MAANDGDLWGFSTLERPAADLRYVVRQLIGRPGWTLMVVSTLALGVGANASIFTLVDTMLFRPAPWNETGRLVWILSVNGRSSGPGHMSYPDYLTYRDHATTVSGVLAYSGNGVAIGGARAEYVNAGLVSGNYFDVLGIRVEIGRAFMPEEDVTPGAHPVLVLSDPLWRQHFGADPEVINRTVAINGHPFTIIAVAPRGFTGIAYADNAEQLWMPLAMQHVAMRANPISRVRSWTTSRKSRTRPLTGASAREHDARISGRQPADGCHRCGPLRRSADPPRLVRTARRL
jgi:putative ABC transport system permease protein